MFYIVSIEIKLEGNWKCETLLILVCGFNTVVSDREIQVLNELCYQWV